jgi:acetyltransferase-like isoleucine patch superfamily enzyme
MSDIKIGKLTTPGMSSGCLIQGINGIIIGNNLWCGPGVKIIGVNHDETDYYQHEHQGTRRVETNVWIGAESIVTQDIESDSVATGNPTKIIRKKKPYREDPI